MAVKLRIVFHEQLAQIGADVVRLMVPKVECCGDLAEHVTRRPVTDLGPPLTLRMGEPLAQTGSRWVMVCDPGTTPVP